MKFSEGWKTTFLYRYVGSAFTHPKNFGFCVKYPFGKCYDGPKGKFVGYGHLKYEEIPVGGREAMGEALSEELARKLEAMGIWRIHWRRELRGGHIHEKFGTLRLEAICGDQLQEIINKYEVLSYGYCINCGTPVRHLIPEADLFVCSSCYMSSLLDSQKPIDEISSILAETRLTVNEIPVISEYSHGKKVEVDVKERYGIDFKKMGGIKDGQTTSTTDRLKD